MYVLPLFLFLRCFRLTFQQVQELSTQKPLLLVSGFIHDVSTFLDEHPGGRHHLTRYIGKDATAAFFGGVYDHSNAAHNVRYLSFFVSSHALTDTNDMLSTLNPASSHETRRGAPRRTPSRAGRSIDTTFTETTNCSIRRARDHYKLRLIISYEYQYRLECRSGYTGRLNAQKIPSCLLTSLPSL